MDFGTLAAKHSLPGLVKAATWNKHIRSRAIEHIDRMFYKKMVLQNETNKPDKVQEDVYHYGMALLRGLHRALNDGVVSREYLRGSLDLFMEQVVEKRDMAEKQKELGFRPPFFLVISPTGRCNLRCTGCYAGADSEQPAGLDQETFERILDDKKRLWGSRFTVISGGEPMMWRDNGLDILDICRRRPDNYFMIYTNGVLIDDEAAARMAEAGNVSPCISVEGYEKETDERRGRGVYRKILSAFENLRRHGVPIGVSGTATRHNWELLTSDEFYDFYYLDQGAFYGWIFQYMPIGRSPALDLMVPPEERVEMLHRMDHIVRDRKFFVADFWNSGVATSGCISAGREAGYFYIDWNGNITPCVFVPYAADNIYDVYARGDDLSAVLNLPWFKEIRRWQDDYGFANAKEDTGNWLCPCAIRDHFGNFRETAVRHGAAPINEAAEDALTDEEYRRGMVDYGREIKRLTDPMWEADYLGDAQRKKAVN